MFEFHFSKTNPKAIYYEMDMQFQSLSFKSTLIKKALLSPNEKWEYALRNFKPFHPTYWAINGTQETKYVSLHTLLVIEIQGWDSKYVFDLSVGHDFKNNPTAFDKKFKAYLLFMNKHFNIELSKFKDGRDFLYSENY